MAKSDEASTTRAKRGNPPLRAVDGRVPGRRGLATRKRLVECTIDLLATTSYRDLKVTDITRAAGTSPATFYQYFVDLETVLLAVAEQTVEEGQRQRLIGTADPRAVGNLVADMGKLRGGEPERQIRGPGAVEPEVVGRVEHIGVGDFARRAGGLDARLDALRQRDDRRDRRTLGADPRRGRREG